VSRLAPREPAEVRLAAPVSLDDLLWIANTSHGPGAHWHARPVAGDVDHDHLRDRDDARRYLADHGVPVPAGPPDAATLAGLALVRGLIRDRLLRGGDPWSPAVLALFEATPFRLDPDGRIAGRDPGWPGFVAGLLAAVPALVLARARLRACANPQCRLVFLDGSRNHRRTWCDTAGCGNRSRVGRARARAVSRPGRPS
jgi:hypothetical protein